MPPRANYENKSAPIYADFVRPFLERRFDKAVIDTLFENLPCYSRGPRKGMLKGYLFWKKCHSGGWITTGQAYGDGPGSAQGYVMRPGTHHLIVRLGRSEGDLILLDEKSNTTDDLRIKGIKERLA